MIEDLPYQQPLIKGTVYLPTNKDRQVMVDYCLMNEVVFVRSSDPTGENVFGPIRVPSALINEIEFPKGDVLGSTVTCLSHPVFKTYEVVAVYKKSDVRGRVFEEDGYVVGKETPEALVSLSLSGKRGEFTMVADQRDLDGSKSSMRFLSKKSSAELEIYIQGILSLLLDKGFDLKVGSHIDLTVYDKDQKKATLNYTLGTGLTYSDEFENTLAFADRKVSIKTKAGEELTLEGGFTIKTEKEDLKSILSDLLSEVENLIIQTPNGAGKVGPSSTAALEKIKTRLSNLFK